MEKNADGNAQLHNVSSSGYEGNTVATREGADIDTKSE
jgi:hypothetical protein